MLSKKKILILVFSAVLILAAGIVYGTVIKPDSVYQQAAAAMAGGNFDQAEELYRSLGSYKDASSQIVECQYQHAQALRASGDYSAAYAIFESILSYKDAARIIAADGQLADEKIRGLRSSMQAGDTVKYGFYEQDNDLENGPEEIEWIVLDVKDDEALLLSRYILEVKDLDYENWEQGKQRDWLNHVFLFNAFSYDERRHLKYADVAPDNNPNFPKTAEEMGNATLDRVFLLSLTEAEQYIQNDGLRIAQPTQYAASLAETSRTWQWKLRTQGKYPSYTVTVTKDGINYEGHPYDAHSVSYDNGRTWSSFGYRPAIMIDLSLSEDLARMKDDEKWQDAVFCSSKEFESGLKEYLNIEADEPFYSEDLLKIEECGWSYGYPMDQQEYLSILLEMKNLKSLVIHWNHFQDVEVDFRQLAELPSLTSLSFDCIDLKDPSFLESLKNLTSLSIGRLTWHTATSRDSSIPDITPISALTNLVSLDLSGNWDNHPDLTALRGLKNLTTLNLETCAVSSADALAELSNLTTLDLCHNKLTDISGLSKLTKLKYLDLTRNAIEDFSPLALLPELEELSVTYHEQERKFTGTEAIRGFLVECGALRPEE